MIKHCILISLTFLSACSSNTGNEQSENETQIKNTFKEVISEYTLVRDDLYSDKQGNLYLKAINNEDFDANGMIYPKDVWLTHVFCDSMIQTDNGLDYIDLKMKDIVDQETWKFDSASYDGRFRYYSDKNNNFFHHLMADGGNISLIKK